MAGSVLDKVTQALGRTAPLLNTPVPPVLEEPLIRLVHSDIGLAELFTRKVRDNNMGCQPCRPEELLDQLTAYLRENGCHRIAMPVSKLLDSLDVPQRLRDAGFDARRWDAMSLDEVYDMDCGLTDVTYAVAETGSLVMRSTPGHGRALSLVPPIHVAVVEPRNYVGDLLDCFTRLTADREPGAVSFITGPSRTADIEMNLVVGVHGPCKVQVFVLE